MIAKADANDTNMLLADEHLHYFHSNLNSKLNLINQWIKSDKLQFNVVKTKYICSYIFFQNCFIKICLNCC